MLSPPDLLAGGVAVIEVSVILPTRNRPGMLTRALSSALAQSMRRFEVIVVDDGSDMEMRALTTSFKDERVRYVRHEHSFGVAAARNTGLTHGRGHWAAFLDDDDVWAPEKLAFQLRALEAVTARWSCCNAVHVDSRRQILKYDRASCGGDVSRRLLAGNSIPGGASGVVCARQLAIDVGAFDTSLSILADWDMWIRLAMASPLAVVDRTLLGYMVHTGSMSSDINAAEREFDYVNVKYARERTARDVRVNHVAWSVHLAEIRRRGGRNISAARTSFKAAALRPSPRLIAWAAVSSLPGSGRVRARRRRARMPQDERARIERWLAAADQPSIRR